MVNIQLLALGIQYRVNSKLLPMDSIYHQPTDVTLTLLIGIAQLGKLDYSMHPQHIGSIEDNAMCHCRWFYVPHD